MLVPPGPTSPAGQAAERRPDDPVTGDPLPPWCFAEFDPVGTDLASAEAVAAFDRNQGTDPVRDSELLARLGAAPERVLVDLGCGTGSLLVEAARPLGARLRSPLRSVGGGKLGG